MAFSKYKRDEYTYLIFNSSEKWKVPRGVETVDIHIVNGGYRGAWGTSERYNSDGSLTELHGGRGGDGGKYRTEYDYNVKGKIIDIIIASEDSNSSFDGMSGTTRYANGGEGAVLRYQTYYHGYSYGRPGRNGGDGHLCPLNNVRYGGGGGGGSARISNSDSPDWSGYSESGGYNGSGRNGNGGHGGTRWHDFGYSDYNRSSAPSHGSSGVIIVRFHTPKKDSVLFFANNF